VASYFGCAPSHLKVCRFGRRISSWACLIVMNLLKSLLSVRPEVNCLLAGSISALLVKVLWLDRYPALFVGAYELGLIIEAVLISIPASYVFYFIVVHLKEVSDRSAIYPYAAKHVSRIVGTCCSQLAEVGNASGCSLALATADKATITAAFENIHPYSDAPAILSPGNARANWFQYFDYHRRRSQDSIAKVMAQLIYLDARLVALLSAIDDCSHFTQLDIVANVKLNNTDLTAWASTFAAYCYKCKELDAYREAHLSRVT